MDRRQLLKIAGGGSKIIAQGLVTNVMFDTEPVFITEKSPNHSFVISSKGTGLGPYEITFGYTDENGNAVKTGIPTVEYNLSELLSNKSNVLEMTIDSKYLPAEYFDTNDEYGNFLSYNAYLSSATSAFVTLSDTIRIWDGYGAYGIVYGPEEDYVQLAGYSESCGGIVNSNNEGFKSGYICYLVCDTDGPFGNIEYYNMYEGALVGLNYSNSMYKAIVSVESQELFDILYDDQNSTYKVIMVNDVPCIVKKDSTDSLMAPFDIYTPLPGGNSFQSLGMDYIPLDPSLLFPLLDSTSDVGTIGNFNSFSNYYIRTGSSFYINDSKVAVGFSVEDVNRCKMAFLNMSGALYAGPNATKDVCIVIGYGQGGEITNYFSIPNNLSSQEVLETDYDTVNDVYAQYGIDSPEYNSVVDISVEKSCLYGSAEMQELYNTLSSDSSNTTVSVFLIWTNTSSDELTNASREDFYAGNYVIKNIVRIDCTNFEECINGEGKKWYIPTKSKKFDTQYAGMPFMDE